MSLEARRETVTQVWPDWHDAVINGVYPLQRILYGSESSAVFLTEGNAQTTAAAIKIVAIERVLPDLQLRHWKTAAALSHPHLTRLLDSGHCQVGGQQFLFVVMEYAEQTLAQVLPHRALTPDEVQEMLLPTLDALGYLHRKNLVHGQLKPANFLVINDRLKLAAETVRPVGEPRPRLVAPSLYDPPEANHGRLFPAGDIWGLGITLVEALTQSLPWPDQHSGSAHLPTTVPAAFVDTVRRCLSHNPGSRPLVADLEARFKRTPRAAVVSVPQPVVRETLARAAPPEESPRQRRALGAVVAAALLVLLLAVWAGSRWFHGQPHPEAPTSSPVEMSSQQRPAMPANASQSLQPPLPAPPPVSAPRADATARASKPSPPRPASRRPDQPARPLAHLLPSVVHVQIPAVPRSALRTIHGHVKVAVLVMVDRTGNVSDALLENPGPSSYFAHLAREAARKWTFAPADQPDLRQWLLSFEFTRDGAAAGASPRS
jgi:TonB family protein